MSKKTPSSSRTRLRTKPSPLSNVRASRRICEVGYGRPPVEHRFKPGTSGNPGGRPRGSKNEATILRSVLNRKVPNRERGRVRTVSLREAIILKFVEDALKGNPKSAAFLLNRDRAFDTGEAPSDLLGEDDQQILEAFARKLALESKDMKK